MSQKVLTSIERFESLLKNDRRYKPEAYNFVYEALDWTLNNSVEGPCDSEHHVSGQELVEGIRHFALNKFGPLTSIVFSNWGVSRTDDWGEIVFNLIEYDLMGKQESDKKEDFSSLYDFNRVFDVEPELDYDNKNGAWKVTYRLRGERPQIKSQN